MFSKKGRHYSTNTKFLQERTRLKTSFPPPSKRNHRTEENNKQLIKKKRRISSIVENNTVRNIRSQGW